jgi:hypothetical protein
MSPLDNTPELKKYIDLEAEQARIGVELSDLCADIIKKYCPFKVGQRVSYGSKLEKRGIIQNIYYKGPNTGLNGFVYYVRQCKKNWEFWVGRNPESIGKYKHSSDRMELFPKQR